MYQFVTSLPQQLKALLLLLTDLALVLLAFFLTLAFTLNNPWPVEQFIGAWQFLGVISLGAVGLALAMRLHLAKVDGFDFSAIGNVAVWALLLTITAFAATWVLGLDIPANVPLIFGPILFTLVLISRLMAHKFASVSAANGTAGIPVAVYGAGAGGVQLVAALKNSREYDPALLVDDSKHLQGLTISGLRVFKPSAIERYLKQGRIEKVFLAIPSISSAKKQQIIRSLAGLGCEVQEVPSYVEIIQSGGVYRSLRPVSPEALLGRDGVDVNIPEAQAAYGGVNVLVSGGGGSIGSELCRQIMELKPRKLVLLEISELALYTIEQEFRPLARENGIDLVTVLGSVADRTLLDEVLSEHSIDVVLHAAAYKHVPLLEINTLAAISNNVFGTKTIAEAAVANHVKRFTLVSTDKAVRPTNVMGASKRIAEMIIQDLQDTNSDTVFSIVRFGNVLGSSGSVIPLFKKQIENGGPVTVTHNDVTRFFMTIPEAARLVLLAGAFAEGGDVFVLDMGKPIKIIDMARQMIELSGLTVRDEDNPDGDIAIEVSGLRAGEKLFEELLIDENTLSTPHPKILRAKERKLTKAKIKSGIGDLKKSISNNDEASARKVLTDLVEGCTLS